MGNIAELIQRVPKIASNQEIIFVEGNSTDDTWAEINRQISERQFFERGIALSALQQFGKGKGDAVRRGFDSASGEILMILDADISVEPEELGKFYKLIATGYCEFANGSRLVYPMEDGAMRFLNLIGNKFFGRLFSFLIRQPVGDTLCGTKVLWKKDYIRIAESRSHFGDFDPFGDFDLLFGAARLHLKIVDVPVHYKERKYGATNISRFRHGLLLFKMSFVAARKLLFVA
jgi:glycosyltransferase involved in cell wall biosynthesis